MFLGGPQKWSYGILLMTRWWQKPPYRYFFETKIVKSIQKKKMFFSMFSMFSFNFTNESLADPTKVILTNTKVTIHYPCENNSFCTAISIALDPGRYQIELYGASGGISKLKMDQVGLTEEDFPCSGGYVSGILTLPQKANFFLHIGGQGSHYQSYWFVSNLGGYNGGGGSASGSHPSTGGGSTDLRALVDDPFHRILVAGGGGSADDASDDHNGIGGAGGGLVAQGIFVWKKENESYVANQTSGFSFFQGERGIYGASNNPNGVQTNYTTWSELEGGGGGWYGGFSPHNCDGGSGGGSSFALTENAELPDETETLSVYDENYENPITGTYAFQHDSMFTFSHVIHKRGVWSGPGLAVITLLPKSTGIWNAQRTYKAQLFLIFI